MTTTSQRSNRVDLDSQTAQWLDAYREAKAQVDHWQTIADRAREHVEDALGEAEDGYVDGKPAVRWSYVRSSRIDIKKLQAEQPEIADSFRVPVITRRFTLAKP